MLRNAIWMAALLFFSATAAGETGEGVKFAFYSASWQANNRDLLRVVAFNPLATEVRIESINFVDLQAPGGGPLELRLGLDVPAGGYAEREMEHVDLLGESECIGDTLAGD